MTRPARHFRQDGSAKISHRSRAAAQRSAFRLFIETGNPMGVYSCGDHFHLFRRGRPDGWARDWLLTDLELGTRASEEMYYENVNPERRFTKLAKAVARRLGS